MKSSVITLLCAAVALAGCGPQVTVPGESSGSGQGGGGGAGGSGNGGGSASSSTMDPSGVDGCPRQCNGPSTSTTCACAVSCDGLSKISCAPAVDVQGNEHIECVCTYQEQFSGACYETNTAAMCDPRAGCCFKYFQATE
jgi:hypothetical protein